MQKMHPIMSQNGLVYDLLVILLFIYLPKMIHDVKLVPVC